MAGNESLKGKENTHETCFINKSVSQLNTILASKAKHQIPQYRDNDFTLFLKPYLTNNKVIVFYHFLEKNLPTNLLVIEDCVQKPKTKWKFEEVLFENKIDRNFLLRITQRSHYDTIVLFEQFQKNVTFFSPLQFTATPAENFYGDHFIHVQRFVNRDPFAFQKVKN